MGVGHGSQCVGVERRVPRSEAHPRRRLRTDRRTRGRTPVPTVVTDGTAYAPVRGPGRGVSTERWRELVRHRRTGPREPSCCRSPSGTCFGTSWRTTGSWGCRRSPTAPWSGSASTTPIGATCGRSRPGRSGGPRGSTPSRETFADRFVDAAAHDGLRRIAAHFRGSDATGGDRGRTTARTGGHRTVQHGTRSHDFRRIVSIFPVFPGQSCRGFRILPNIYSARAETTNRPRWT